MTMAFSSLTVISGFSVNSSDRYAYTVTECDKTCSCCTSGEKQATSLSHWSDQKQEKMPKDWDFSLLHLFMEKP